MPVNKVCPPQTVSRLTLILWKKIGASTGSDYDPRPRADHQAQFGGSYVPKSADGYVDPTGVNDCITTEPVRLDYNEYTLVRLSNIGYHINIDTKLDELVSHKEILHMEELEDESLELAILQSYLPSLEDQLRTMFPAYKIEPNYDPTTPKEQDVTVCGYAISKFIETERFFERVKRIKKGAWPQAAAFYSYLQEGLRQKSSSQIGFE